MPGVCLLVHDPSGTLPTQRGPLHVTLARTDDASAHPILAGFATELFQRWMLQGVHTVALDAVEVRPADGAGRHAVWLRLADPACLRAGRAQLRRLLDMSGRPAPAEDTPHVTIARCDTAAAAAAELARIAPRLPMHVQVTGVYMSE